MDLSNQSAIVTGGASGLGHATARRLADAGAAVVVVDLPDREGETVRADAVAALGPRARFVTGDVTAEDTAREAAARELASSQIRVVTIAPGLMETPMMAGLPEAAREALSTKTPHPARLGRPEDYALLVEQIVSNPFLNGEVIRLDGAVRLEPR